MMSPLKKKNTDDIIIEGDFNVIIAPFFKKVDKQYRRNVKGRNCYEYHLSTSAFYIDNLDIVRKYTTNKCLKFTYLKFQKNGKEIILNDIITIRSIVNALISINNGIAPLSITVNNMLIGHVFNFIIMSFLKLNHFKYLPSKCSMTNKKCIKIIIYVKNEKKTVKKFHSVLKNMYLPDNDDDDNSEKYPYYALDVNEPVTILKQTNGKRVCLNINLSAIKEKKLKRKTSSSSLVCPDNVEFFTKLNKACLIISKML